MAVKSNAVEAAAPAEPKGLKPLYLEAVSRVERLHRRLLVLLKDELDRMGWADINPVQALLMFNIGDAEMTAGELRSRGYYLGSNVSYNLKKLVETGYIFQERSRADRRSVRIRLTLLYGGLFLVCGVILLAITFGLYSNATDNSVLTLSL